ncbi:extracellular solute-binding protein [Paenibacillus spongiae]|uniref:Extracellular solute-binding protein n=1 Tax=Paenibacillus spongiae TaxID=2909671 RepID=A0ABY5SMB9_9BACL|nr:extracellular solute-binding protein [Paenibacillus spongiae]UVI33373.1 extracellular solute-binding protein [Paenibacillus spongiae]
MKWQEAYNDILPKGYAGIANMWPSEIYGLTTVLQKNDPNAKYVPMPLPKAPGVTNSQLERINTLGGSGIVISSKVKDPERLFKYIDWMATNEGWSTMTFGPPSKDNGTWYIDEQGKFIDNEQLQKQKSAEIPRWGVDVLGNWAYGLPGVLKYTQDLLMDEARQPEPLRELAKQQYANEIFIDTVYDIFLNSQPGPVRIAKGIDLDKIFKETEARIIMQSKDDADVEKMYASMMAEAEKAGFTEILKEDYVRYMAVKEKYGK